MFTCKFNILACVFAQVFFFRFLFPEAAHKVSKELFWWIQYVMCSAVPVLSDNTFYGKCLSNVPHYFFDKVTKYQLSFPACWLLFSRETSVRSGVRLVCHSCGWCSYALVFGL